MREFKLFIDWHKTLNIKSAKQSLTKSRHETHQRKLSVSEVEAADSGAPHINQRTNQHIDLSRR